MFNEAFWFFYLVDISASVSGVGWGLFILFGIVSTIFIGIAYLDEVVDAKKPLFRVFLPLCFIGLILGISAPPKEAFYAGAGQYVGESMELDDTLLNLKKLVDQKIADAGLEIPDED